MDVFRKTAGRCCRSPRTRSPSAPGSSGSSWVQQRGGRAALARAARAETVMDRCVKIEHGRACLAASSLGGGQYPR
mgnify:CR=1 FL=1